MQDNLDGEIDRQVLMLLVPAILAPLLLAALLFVIVFPFILTAFLSPLYRGRLMTVFAATPTPQPEPSAGPPVPAG